MFFFIQISIVPETSKVALHYLKITLQEPNVSQTRYVFCKKLKTKINFRPGPNHLTKHKTENSIL